MPLTRRTPPAPVAAIHASEVAAAADGLTRSALAYLRRLLWALEYSRTQWLRGTGQDGRPGVVIATPQGPLPGAVAGPWTAGTTVPAASALRGQPVLLALQTDNDPPTRTPHRYFDGLLVSTVPQPPPPLPALPPPVPPATGPTDLLDDETLPAYTEAWGRYLAGLLGQLVDRELRAHWDSVTRFVKGTVASVNVRQRTAWVTLDHLPDETVTPVLAGFGTRRWAASQLAGRYVRLGWDPVLGYFIDDWA
jgi:hypothetical protein